MTARKDRAGFNEIFVCAACSRCFADRAATAPVEVTGEVLHEHHVAVPHPKYPDDPELATTRRDHHDTLHPHPEKAAAAKAAIGMALDAPHFVVPARPALACCPTHTVLCDSRTMRFHQRIGEDIEVCGAARRE